MHLFRLYPPHAPKDGPTDVYLNPDHIVSIRPSESGGTEIHLAGHAGTWIDRRGVDLVAQRLVELGTS